VAERTDAHPVEGGVSVQNREKRLDRRVALGIDVESGIGELFEEIRQQWNGMVAADSSGRHVAPGKFADSTRAPAGSPEIVVVKGHQDTIGSGVHVGLEMSEAEIDGMAKGRHGVLGSVTGSTPVSEGEEPTGVITLQIRMSTHRDDYGRALTSGSCRP
jgi:hypothetical protein